MQGELEQIVGDLTTLHKQGVLDDADYEAARQRTAADFVKRGAKGVKGVVEVYKGVLITRQGDKFVVTGNEYDSIGSAKAVITAKTYLEHYKR